MLIDTHCHLTSSELANQLDAVVQRAAEVDVQQLVTVAVTPADTRAALDLMKGRPAVYLAAGIHPHEAACCTSDDRAALAALHRGQWAPGRPTERLVAVGEIGLDFHYDFAPPAVQEEVFRFQLELACEVRRPVIVHARQAEQRVCDVLADYPLLAERLVFHCYSGDTRAARRILDMGFWLSFTGVVTFRNAQAVREAARFVPGDRMMLETDAPYLAPEPVRNVRPCEPALLVHTARHVADIRCESFEAFAANTSANAQRFFNLQEKAS